MLSAIKYESLEKLIADTVPANILLSESAIKGQNDVLGEPVSEFTALNFLRQVASKNKVHKNYIGNGYNPVIVPPVVLRNVLENPAWYTSYTPYQVKYIFNYFYKIIFFIFNHCFFVFYFHFC